MYRRRLVFSSSPFGGVSNLPLVCALSVRRCSTESFQANPFRVSCNRALGLPPCREMRPASHCHLASSSPPWTHSLSSLASSQRWYVYQPPGSREPNMPWFRSSAATPSSASPPKNTSFGNTNSQPQRLNTPIPSTHPSSVPFSSSLHPPRETRGVGGAPDRRRPLVASPTERQGNLTRSQRPPLVSSAPSPPSPPRPTSATPSSSISALWGTRVAPSPPSAASTASPSMPPPPRPISDITIEGGAPTWTASSRLPAVSPPLPSPLPPPSTPVEPQWTGPLDLRTPLSHILRRREKEEEGKKGEARRSNENVNDSSASSTGDKMLHELAALLIDPAALNTVERIPLRTFVWMQPKRQLLALQGNKEWWEWIVQSAPYREAVEQVKDPLHTTVAETTLKQDRRILKEAGLMTLQDWVEHQHLVAVSPQTKSALDAAVTTTVQQHVSQVLSVVKQCHRARHPLRRWLSDVVGKFILDSLRLSVEAAAVSVQKARGARWSSRRGLFAPPATAEEGDIADYDALEEEEHMKEDERAMAAMMLMGTNALGGAKSNAARTRAASVGNAKKKNVKKSDGSPSASPASASSPPLRPGEVCTVEHYLLFLQKVTASVRQDRWQQERHSRRPGSSRNPGHGREPGGMNGHTSNSNTASSHETSQEEWEVQERTKAIVASAFSHLLQHAMQLSLPKELRELADGGYLALERVPVLLQRAAAQLQLRTFPVGYFIVHSTAQDGTSPAPFSSMNRSGSDGGLQERRNGRGMSKDAFVSASSLYLEGSGSNGMGVITDVVPLSESGMQDTSHPPDFMGETPRGQALPGAFLTDEEDPSIPLMLWKRPRRTLQGTGGKVNGRRHEMGSPGTPLSSSPRQGSGRATLYDGESLQESYYSMLFHLQSALEKLSFTTIEELFDDADSLSGCPHSTVWNPSVDTGVSASSSLAWSSSIHGGSSYSSSSGGGGGICSSSSMLSAIFGESPLFGSAKLVEDQLTTAVSMPPSASTVEKPPLYFIEAGANCGKTALLERLQQRLRSEEMIRTTSDGSASPWSTALVRGSTNTRGGAVLIRYHSATTPFIPDLDDHPMAFAARFWFRVILGTMPYFTRSELLYSRAPTSSPLWWSSQPHQQHWSYQTIVQSGALPHNCVPSCVLVDDMHHVLDAMESKWARVLFNARGEPVPAERVRRAFDMAVQMEEEEEEEQRQRRAKEEAEASGEISKSGEGGQQERGGFSRSHDTEEQETRRQAQRRREQQYQELTRLLSSQSLLEIPLYSNGTGADGTHSRFGSGEDHVSLLGASASRSAVGAGPWPLPSDGMTAGGGGGTRGRMSATLFAASRRQQAAEALQRRTGHSMGEILSTCMLHITAGMSEMHLVFAGQRVSPLLLAYGGGTRVVRQFHLPVLRPGSMSWQQRVRVLPPLAVLQALHRRAGLEMPGLLYEVIKNSPAFIGSTMELLWAATGRNHSNSAASGTHAFNRSYLTLGGSTSSSPAGINGHPTEREGEGSKRREGGVDGDGGLPGTSSYLLQRFLLKQYDAQNLFLELPLRNRLLCHPQHACQRLVELLQRQLCSPNGYLTTLVDTTLEDAEMGLVMPHSHTFSQVHPFALFIIFSHQATLQQQHSPSPSLLSSSEKKHKKSAQEDDSAAVEEDVESTSASRSPRTHRHMEQQIVQAWTEVWAEYKETVQCMATTPSRKKEALRVLLHGALLLRAAALSRTEMSLNCPVPPYGFPLLASDMRVRPGRSLPSAATASFAALRQHQEDAQAMELRPATRDSVRRAAAAYKSFFAQVMQTNHHFAFRPVVGLNAGCDVVLWSGHTLYLYDIAISSYHLGRVIQRRFAEALLGVLHLLKTQVLSRDQIHHVQYVTVVCCDQEEEPAYYRHGDGDSIAGNGSTSELLLSQGRPLLSRSYQSLFSSSSYSTSSFSRTFSGGVGGGENDDEGTIGRPFSSSSVVSPSGNTSSFALQRPDNVGAAVPLILDYSALLDDDTMDILQYLRGEVLGMGAAQQTSSETRNDAEPDEGEGAAQERATASMTTRTAAHTLPHSSTEEAFRTVQDILDALEREFRLPVRQRVLSTFEELEALFSPTLLQLIPDSMLLPPFTPAVVSSEDLLREVLQQQQEEENVIEGEIGDGEGGDLFMRIPSVPQADGAEWEDIEQDQFLAQEQVAMGHASSSPENPFLADQELLESTDLLEAMMNDDGAQHSMEPHHSSGRSNSGTANLATGKDQQEGAGSAAVATTPTTPIVGEEWNRSGNPPAAPVEGTFSWLQQAIPQAAASLSSPQASFSSSSSSMTTAGPSEPLPFPYSAASSIAHPQPPPPGYATPQDIQTAQHFIHTGGYNTATLPLHDHPEEMERENGALGNKMEKDGEEEGSQGAPLPMAGERFPAERETGQSSQADFSLSPAGGKEKPQRFENEEDELEEEEEDEWEDEEELDEGVNEGGTLEGGEEEGAILHKKKGVSSGSERGEKGRGRATTRSGRDGNSTLGTHGKVDGGWVEELKVLTKKSERGVPLSAGERRRLRRLRRRRLAAAASGGKDQKLTVAAALRLRQQQKKENVEKSGGVSSITGMSYDEEARFLERFLADERRRQQLQQRRRIGGGSSAVLKKKKKGSSGSKSKHKPLKQKSSKRGTGKVGSTSFSGSSSSSSSSSKKSTRVARSSSSSTPARQPRRLKRA